MALWGAESARGKEQDAPFLHRNLEVDRGFRMHHKIKAWVGKKVRTTGALSEYGSDLQMIIERWDQIVEVKRQ
jgi:hypothetical protein